MLGIDILRTIEAIKIFHGLYSNSKEYYTAPRLTSSHSNHEVEYSLGDRIPTHLRISILTSLDFRQIVAQEISDAGSVANFFKLVYGSSRQLEILVLPWLQSAEVS